MFLHLPDHLSEPNSPSEPLCKCSYLVDFDAVCVDLAQDLALERHQLLLPQAVGLRDDGHHVDL